MKNILIIINSLQFGGGAEKVATMIGDQLSQEEGYIIQYLTFYNAQKKYPYKGEEICLNETISCNVFIRIFKLFHRAYTIARICRKYHIDYAFSHLEEANFSNIISKMVFRNTSKIYIQIHGSVNMWGNAYKFFIKKYYKKADKIITIVQEEKENLLKNFNIDIDKIVVVYNPVEIESINILKEAILGKYNYLFDNKKFTFINIGRLCYEKNQTLLIEAFSVFNKKYKNTQLLILGEGVLRKSLEEQIGENKNVHLLGNQNNPYCFLKNANCFISTSRSEGLPGALLESLVIGLPIISTDCSTGPREILQRNIHDFYEKKDVYMAEYGILTPRFNVEKIVNSMEKIYLNKDLQETYRKKSLERARDFDIKDIIKQWKKIFV